MLKKCKSPCLKKNYLTRLYKSCSVLGEKKKTNELLQSIYVLNSGDKWCWSPAYLSCQKFGTLLRHVCFWSQCSKIKLCRLFHIKTLGLEAFS